MDVCNTSQVQSLNLTSTNVPGVPLVACCTQKSVLERNYYLVQSLYRLDDIAGQYRIVIDQIQENARRLNASYQQLSTAERELLMKAIETAAYGVTSVGTAVAATAVATVAWPWALILGSSSLLSGLKAFDSYGQAQEKFQQMDELLRRHGVLMDQYRGFLERAGLQPELWNLPNKTPKLYTCVQFLRPFLKDRSNIVDIKDFDFNFA